MISMFLRKQDYPKGKTTMKVLQLKESCEVWTLFKEVHVNGKDGILEQGAQSSRE